MDAALHWNRATMTAVALNTLLARSQQSTTTNTTRMQTRIRLPLAYTSLVFDLLSSRGFRAPSFHTQICPIHGIRFVHSTASVRQQLGRMDNRQHTPRSHHPMNQNNGNYRGNSPKQPQQQSQQQNHLPQHPILSRLHQILGSRNRVEIEKGIQELIWSNPMLLTDATFATNFLSALLNLSGFEKTFKYRLLEAATLAVHYLHSSTNSTRLEEALSSAKYAVVNLEEMETEALLYELERADYNLDPDMLVTKLTRSVHKPDTIESLKTLRKNTPPSLTMSQTVLSALLRSYAYLESRRENIGHATHNEYLYELNRPGPVANAYRRFVKKTIHQIVSDKKFGVLLEPLLEDMGQRSLVLQPIVYQNLIEYAVANGDMESALRFYQDMQTTQYDESAEISAIMRLILGYGKVKDLQRVEDWYNRATQLGLVPQYPIIGYFYCVSLILCNQGKKASRWISEQSYKTTQQAKRHGPSSNNSQQSSTLNKIFSIDDCYSQIIYHLLQSDNLLAAYRFIHVPDRKKPYRLQFHQYCFLFEEAVYKRYYSFAKELYESVFRDYVPKPHALAASSARHLAIERKKNVIQLIATYAQLAIDSNDLVMAEQVLMKILSETNSYLNQIPEEYTMVASLLKRRLAEKNAPGSNKPGETSHSSQRIVSIMQQGLATASSLSANGSAASPKASLNIDKIHESRRLFQKFVQIKLMDYRNSHYNELRIGKKLKAFVNFFTARFFEEFAAQPAYLVDTFRTLQSFKDTEMYVNFSARLIQRYLDIRKDLSSVEFGPDVDVFENVYDHDRKVFLAEKLKENESSVTADMFLSDEPTSSSAAASATEKENDEQPQEQPTASSDPMPISPQPLATPTLLSSLSREDFSQFLYAYCHMYNSIKPTSPNSSSERDALFAKHGIPRSFPYMLIYDMERCSIPVEPSTMTLVLDSMERGCIGQPEQFDTIRWMKYMVDKEFMTNVEFENRLNRIMHKSLNNGGETVLSSMRNNTSPSSSSSSPVKDIHGKELSPKQIAHLESSSRKIIQCCERDNLGQALTTYKQLLESQMMPTVDACCAFLVAMGKQFTGQVIRSRNDFSDDEWRIFVEKNQINFALELFHYLVFQYGSLSSFTRSHYAATFRFQLRQPNQLRKIYLAGMKSMIYARQFERLQQMMNEWSEDFGSTGSEKPSVPLEIYRLVFERAGTKLKDLTVKEMKIVMKFYEQCRGITESTDKTEDMIRSYRLSRQDYHHLLNALIHTKPNAGGFIRSPELDHLKGVHGYDRNQEELMDLKHQYLEILYKDMAESSRDIQPQVSSVKSAYAPPPSSSSPNITTPNEETFELLVTLAVSLNEVRLLHFFMEKWTISRTDLKCPSTKVISMIMGFYLRRATIRPSDSDSAATAKKVLEVYEYFVNQCGVVPDAVMLLHVLRVIGEVQGRPDEAYQVLERERQKHHINPTIPHITTLMKSYLEAVKEIVEKNKSMSRMSVEEKNLVESYVDKMRQLYQFMEAEPYLPKDAVVQRLLMNAYKLTENTKGLTELNKS